MNKADVSFKVGLDTSPAERQLDVFYQKLKSKNSIVFSANTDANGFIPSTPRNSPTTFGSGSNLPATTITRALEKITSFFQGQSQGIPGWRWAGSSVWNEQKKIGYDNLPTASVGNKIQETINYIFSQQARTSWKYAGSSIAHSAYDDFRDMGKGNGSSSATYAMHPWQDKNMADVNKKDNVELKDKLLIWSKILVVVYAVKKVVEGLLKAAKIWQFGADTASSRNNNINEELGYFSTDPVGAMRANVDKTRSMLYAGVRNLGENTPVSKEGVDYFSNKITEMWTAAMSGRNVDARTTIDVQRLKDFFGIDLTVAGLLTRQREGKTATDVQLDVMKKIETQLQKLNEADEITKGQVIDSLKNVLGEEMIDAIVANYNKNIKLELDDRFTVAEKLMNAGSSALSPQDLTAKTNDAVTALSNFHTALENLKNTITVTFAPAFETVTDTLTDFVNWLNKKMTKTTGEKDETGGYSSDVTPEAIKSSAHLNWISKASSDGKVFGTYNERAKKANELLKNASSVNDILDAVYLLNPFVEKEGDIESLKTRRFAREAGNALIKGELDPNSANPFIRKIANYEYGGKTGIDAFKMAMSMGVFGNINDMKFLSSLVFDPSEFEDKTVEDFLPKKYESMNADKKAKAYEKALKKLEEYNYNKNKRKYAAVNQLMQTDEFGRWVSELFGSGGAFDLKEDESIASYLFDPTSYQTPEDYYNALKSLKESFDANRWGREYISSFELPSMEELAGADKKLDFGEVRFKLTLTDQAGTVLGSQEIIGAVQ